MKNPDTLHAPTETGASSATMSPVPNMPMPATWWRTTTKANTALHAFVLAMVMPPVSCAGEFFTVHSINISATIGTTYVQSQCIV